MKKYIYGTILVSAVAACVIFFLKPPEVTDHPAQTLLAITFRFPEDYEFTEGAPFALTWQIENPDGISSVPVADRNFNPLVSPYKLAVTPKPGTKAVILNAQLYYCQKTTRMCFRDHFKTRVSLPGDQNGSAISYVWDITHKNMGTGDSSLGTR